MGRADGIYLLGHHRWGRACVRRRSVASKQRVDGGGGIDERRRRRVLRVAPERPADAAFAPVTRARLLLLRAALPGAALRPCARRTVRLRCRAVPRKHCFCWSGVAMCAVGAWGGGSAFEFEEEGVKVSCAVKLEHVYHFSITITNGVKHQFSES